MKHFRHLSTALGLCALSITSTSFAQNIDLTPLASMGGQLHAAAEACKAYSNADLQALKAKQKSEMAAQGISAQAYDKHFKMGYDKAQADIKSMTADQKTTMCQQLQKIKP